MFGTIAPRLVLILFGTCSTFTAAESTTKLRLATWNVEHLADANDSGCLPRHEADYARLRDQVRALAADVIAFQEVESEKAAYRIFPEAEWVIAISDRAWLPPGPECWENNGKRLRHHSTGFAIRKGITFTQQPTIADIGVGDDGTPSPRMRHGAVIDVGQLRLVSVHLASGCWGTDQDSNPVGRAATVCPALKHQMSALQTWIAEQPFDKHLVILGDFNRRLTEPGDWAWPLLAGTGRLELATEKIQTTCDARYDYAIDHIVISNAGVVSYSEPIEVQKSHEHPDHCAFYADVVVSQNATD